MRVIRLFMVSHISKYNASIEIDRSPPRFILNNNITQAIADFKKADVYKKPQALANVLINSLLCNIRDGLKIFVALVLLTLPFTLTIHIAWDYGWDVSFYKIYDQAFHMPLLIFFTICLYSIVLLYLPFAWAHMILTNRVQAIFDFQLIVSIIRKKLFSALIYASIVLLMGGLYQISMIMVYAADNFGSIQQLSVAEKARWIWRYYFFSACFFLPLTVLLKFLAARIYLSGLFKVYQDEKMRADLPVSIQQVLEHADLPEKKTRSQGCMRLPFRLLKLALIIVTCLVWFFFTMQCFGSQFFHYRGLKGWANRPIIQMPLFKNSSPHLKESQTQDDNIY